MQNFVRRQDQCCLCEPKTFRNFEQQNQDFKLFKLQVHDVQNLTDIQGKAAFVKKLRLQEAHN